MDTVLCQFRIERRLHEAAKRLSERVAQETHRRPSINAAINQILAAGVAALGLEGEEGKKGEEHS